MSGRLVRRGRGRLRRHVKVNEPSVQLNVTRKGSCLWTVKEMETPMGDGSAISQCHEGRRREVKRSVLNGSEAVPGIKGSSWMMAEFNIVVVAPVPSLSVTAFGGIDGMVFAVWNGKECW